MVLKDGEPAQRMETSHLGDNTKITVLLPEDNHEMGGAEVGSNTSKVISTLQKNKEIRFNI